MKGKARGREGNARMASRTGGEGNRSEAKKCKKLRKGKIEMKSE